MLAILGHLRDKRDGVDALRHKEISMETGTGNRGKMSTYQDPFDGADAFTEIAISPRAAGKGASAGAGSSGLQLAGMGERDGAARSSSPGNAPGTQVMSGQRSVGEMRVASPTQDADHSWVRYGPGGGDGRAI